MSEPIRVGPTRGPRCTPGCDGYGAHARNCPDSPDYDPNWMDELTAKIKRDLERAAPTATEREGAEPDPETVAPGEEFDALVESMIGALQLHGNEADGARNWPLISLPDTANGMANRLRRVEEENTTLRDALVAARRENETAKRLAAAVLRYFDPNRHSAIRDAFGYEQSAGESRELKDEMLTLSAAVAVAQEPR